MDNKKKLIGIIGFIVMMIGVAIGVTLSVFGGGVIITIGMCILILYNSLEKKDERKTKL